MKTLPRWKMVSKTVAGFYPNYGGKSAVVPALVEALIRNGLPGDAVNTSLYA